MRFYTVKTGKKSVDGREETTEIYTAYPGEDQAYRLTDLGFSFADMNDLILHLTAEEKERLWNRELVPAQAVPAAIDELKLCAPIEYPRQDVVCLGINYAAHEEEAGRFSKEAFSKDRPDTIYFSKRVNRATAPGEPIPSYQGLVDSLDYEAELGVILGRDAKGVLAKDAGAYIFGYTVINDVSARNLQTKHKQWYLGKSLDGFTPMGPCIVTADEVGDVQDLDISCTVNGEPRQSSNTAYMLQTVGGAIAELSAGITLQAGTIIATGTPAGVGMGMVPPCFLKPGDVITCTIEKIGSLTNVVGE